MMFGSDLARRPEIRPHVHGFHFYGGFCCLLLNGRAGLLFTLPQRHTLSGELLDNSQQFAERGSADTPSPGHCQRKNVTAPVIIYSGELDADLPRKALAAGANGFMRKTDSIHELFAEICRHFAP